MIISKISATERYFPEKFIKFLEKNYNQTTPIYLVCTIKTAFFIKWCKFDNFSERDFGDILEDTKHNKYIDYGKFICNNIEIPLIVDIVIDEKDNNVYLINDYKDIFNH